jgi:arylsulfatase A-like enzyme
LRKPLALAVLALAALVPSPGATGSVNGPNVVLIVTDDQTYDSLRYMPWLSSRDDWVRFTNAFMPTPLCCPGRSTLLTGQYSHHTGIMDNLAPETFRDSDTLATWLHAAGYRTALIGKYLNRYPWDKGSGYVPPGWDVFDAFYGSDDQSTTGEYYDYSLDENGTVTAFGSAPEDYSTDVITSKARDFIGSAPSPFFLELTPSAPHEPYTPAPRDVGTYGSIPIVHTEDFNEADVSDKPAWVRALPLMTATQVAKQDARLRSADETLLAVDDQVRAVTEALQAAGRLDDTVILFMTDNGYSFGSHRIRNKRCEYEYCIRTPLLIRYPGVPGGVRDQLVSAIDIAPTILDATGASATIPQDGRSLVPLVTGTATRWRRAVFFEWKGDGVIANPFDAVQTARYEYVELYAPQDLGGAVTERELYDLVADPHQLTNVAGRPDLARIQARLASRLAGFKAERAGSGGP